MALPRSWKRADNSALSVFSESSRDPVPITAESSSGDRSPSVRGCGLSGTKKFEKAGTLRYPLNADRRRDTKGGALR